MNSLRVLFLGAPGVGKGTYGVRLSQRWKVPHIAMGDLVRSSLQSSSKPDHAENVHAATLQGLLVPDDVVSNLLKERLDQPDVCERSSYILDGYPRTLEQAKTLATLSLTPLLCVNLLMPDKLLAMKISGRRACAHCGWNYNVADIHEDGYALPPLLPQNPTTCDHCGISPLRLERREDDAEHIVHQRLGVYHSLTKPLVTLYEQQGKLLQFEVRNGVADLDKLENHILNHLKLQPFATTSCQQTRFPHKTNL